MACLRLDADLPDADRSPGCTGSARMERCWFVRTGTGVADGLPTAGHDAGGGKRPCTRYRRRTRRRIPANQSGVPEHERCGEVGLH